MALMFAGFNGRPVRGGTGMKAPIVLDERTSKLGLVRKSGPDLHWTDAEIAEYESRGLLSRVASKIAYCEGAIALYAHTDFIAPPLATGSLSLQLEIPEELKLYPQLESYVAFVSPTRAASILQTWAAVFLESARLTLEDDQLSAQERGLMAFADAMRARFSSPMSSGRRSDRAEALALAYVSLWWQGISQKALLAEAERDAMREDVTTRATSLLADLSSALSPVEKEYRDLSAYPYRRLERAA